MSTKRHVYKKLSRAQQEAFEQIATYNDLPQMHPKTREILLKRGLIVEAGSRVVGRDRFGAISIPTYAVPIAEHIEWCRWCSEHYQEPAQ